MTRVEICLETVQSLRAAKLGGADRVELCASLAVGGLTPSPGMMRFAAELGVPTRVLLRPRGGTFVYDADEIAVIERDIAAVKAFGLEGVVIGAALPDDRLDRDALARLLERCEGLGRTLHRAFDRTPDPFDALELAIELGFDRVLTSGQAPLAMDGAGLLERLVAAAAGRIVILPACGIDAENVGALVAAAGVEEVHATCTDQVEGLPDAGKFGFGYPPASTTLQAVETLVRNARNASARRGRTAAHPG